MRLTSRLYNKKKHVSRMCRGAVRHSLKFLLGLDSLKLTDERFLVLRVNPMPHSEQTWHPSLPFWIGHMSRQARLGFPLAARFR